MSFRAHYVVKMLLFAGLAQIVVTAGSVYGAPPSIESVWPPVGQRGTEFQLKIVGSGLTHSQQLLFYSPHLKCTKLQAKSEYEVVATVVAESNCRLGNEPFRLLAKDGFSELRTLRISPFPTLFEQRAEEKAEPMAIGALNVALCGVLESGEYDRYSLSMKAGEKITVEVDAVRLGGELLDTVLSILGPNGELIARADDNSLFQQDPTLSFEAPLDGDYVVDVHESNYGGSDHSYYALYIGTFPMASVVYPAGGQLGTTVHLEFIGDANTQYRKSVELPADEQHTQDFQLLSQQDGVVAPSAIPFRLSKLANALEVEPNDMPQQQQSIAPAPVAFNGILQRPGDIDCFAFEASINRPLLIEAFANRIGSAADTTIAILDDEFNVVAANDDWGSHDSRIEFLPPESGTYYLRVTDKLAAGAIKAVYRVEISPQQPSVTAFLPRPNRLSQQSQAITIPQGNRVLARMGVRRELVDGEVQMQFLDLPSGVQASTMIVPADRFWIPVVLEAKDDALLSGHLAGVEAVCMSENSEVVGQFEQVVDLVAESADQLFQSAHVSRLPVAVTPAMPFSVDLQSPATSLARSGTLDITVWVTRNENFRGPVRIELPFLPPWIVAEPFIVIPPDQSRGIYRLDARQQAAPRTWPLVALARVDTVSATGDTQELDGREVASRIVELTISESPLAGHFQNLAAEQGQSITVQCQLTKRGDAPSNLLATIEGLPNRVSAKPAHIDPSASQIEFQLILEADAPLGQFDSVQCRLSGEANGQAVSFVIATNSKLQITPPGKLFRNADGSILSPLEALRQQRAGSEGPKP